MSLESEFEQRVQKQIKDTHKIEYKPTVYTCMVRRRTGNRKKVDKYAKTF
jgi:hypothetical protein